MTTWISSRTWAGVDQGMAIDNFPKFATIMTNTGYLSGI